ncbi:hypothetical protein MMC30_006785 [Trapelia coarctata]|nr:hypothetical protein [Trapelia coarctata]
MEEVLKRHRQEQRDLQGRITQKKKSATKKTRKGVNDECEELERQLKERQAAELSGITGGSPAEDDNKDAPTSSPENAAQDNIDSLEDAVNGLSVSGEHEKPEDPPPGKKPNRQKARLARRALEQEAAIVQAASEAAALPDHREQEHAIMNREFKTRGLKEKDIRPDGHCLYSAVADQLIVQGLSIATGSVPPEKPEYKVVRRVAADFIAKNPDDFSPFLEEPLEDHIVKVRDTAEWGGQLELSALARAYGVDINVLQGDGRVEKIEAGAGAGGKPIWLAYYRHTYGLGEHYNSLRATP